MGTKFTEDRIDSAYTNASKSGSTVRSQHLKNLIPLAKALEEKFVGEELLYDVTFDSPPQCSKITFTELLSSAIYINACSFEVRNAQIAEAAQGEIQEDICAKIMNSKKDHDKYKLLRNPFMRKIDTVIMLPGSNLYHKIVDKEKVKELVDAGAVIKPHPITNNEVLLDLRMRYGSTKILSQAMSGYDALSKAERVFTTGGSETAMYAVMLGKEIGNIEIDLYKTNSAYREIFRQLISHNEKEKQYETLNRIFNSYKSGIIFEWDDHSKIDTYLDYLKNLVEELKNGK